MTEILRLEDISAGYGDLTILSDVNLTVNAGEKVGVLGPNGAGKTTLINTILGISDIVSGRVFFNGEDITDSPPHIKALKGVGVVPEGKRLFPKMTVLENLKTPAFTTERAKANYEENLQLVFSIFPRLKERLDQKSETLSGGEQQMLAISRSIMMQPTIILLDEPSQSLAPILVEEVYDSLEKMSRKGLTLFIVEQYIAKILDFVDRVYVMERGKIVVEGNPKEVRRKLTKIYLK